VRVVKGKVNTVQVLFFVKSVKQLFERMFKHYLKRLKPGGVKLIWCCGSYFRTQILRGPDNFSHDDTFDIFIAIFS